MASAPPAHVGCPNDEDIYVLAAMAYAQNYAALTSGVVSPLYMRPALRDVARTILEHLRASPKHQGPSLSALRVQWPGVGWPPWSDQESGLSPGPFVESFVAQARQQGITALSLDILAAGGAAINGTPEDYRQFGENLAERAAELRRIGVPNQGASHLLPRSASDLIDTFVGNAPGGVSLHTGDPQIDAVMGPIEPGLWGFFGRPKEGKTHVLYDIVQHLAFVLGLPGVVMDVENNLRDIHARLTCAFAKMPYSELRALMDRRTQYERIHGRNTYALTEREALLLIYLREAGEAMTGVRPSAFLGKMERKDHTPDGFAAGYSVEQILREAQRIDAKWIAIDQVHLLQTERPRRGAQRSEVIHDVCGILDASGLPVIFTTQERRTAVEGQYVDMTLRPPQASDVFGSDAVAQKCTWLGHVSTRSVQRPFTYTDPLDDTGATRETPFLRTLWPVANRHSGTAGMRHAVFTAIDLFSFRKPLGIYEGLELLKQEAEEQREAMGLESAKSSKRRPRSAIPPLRNPKF